MPLITRPPLSGAIGPSTSSSPPSTNLWAYYEPSREAGYVNNDPLTPLTDQTGNGRNWENTVGPPTVPLYDTTDALNGLAVANFTGSRNWGQSAGLDLTNLVAAGFGNSKQAHIFLVVICDADPPLSVADSGLWRFSTTSDLTHFPYTDGTIYDSALKASRDAVGNPSASLASWRVIDVGMSASSGAGVTDGSWIYKVDGTTILSGNIVESGPRSTGALFGSDGTFGFAGKFAGLYFYNAQLGSTPRALVISYINSRFGLSSS